MRVYSVLMLTGKIKSSNVHIYNVIREVRVPDFHICKTSIFPL